MTAPAATATEDRALALLGSGVSAEAVANALGVTPSRVSQLLANKEFADQVATLRYENLQQHNSRDLAYDSLEDTLLTKLEKAIPMMFKPLDITKALQAVNGAKRRGQTAPSDGSVNQQTIVQLLLPTQITQKFTTNVNNQVIKAGDQELLTMQSGNLLSLAEKNEAIPQEPQTDEIQLSDL